MITQPYPSFIDPEVGGRAKPVSNGTIFIGQNQKDPIQFPEKVYYKDSDGTEIEMAQPIHLNSAGVTVASKNSSTVVRPYTKSASYSILIKNSGGNDRYINDSVSGFASGEDVAEAAGYPWIEGETSVKDRIYNYQPPNGPIIKVYDPVGGNPVLSSPDYNIFSPYSEGKRRLRASDVGDPSIESTVHDAIALAISGGYGVLVIDGSKYNTTTGVSFSGAKNLKIIFESCEIQITSDDHFFEFTSSSNVKIMGDCSELKGQVTPEWAKGNILAEVKPFFRFVDSKFCKVSGFLGSSIRTVAGAYNSNFCKLSGNHIDGGLTEDATTTSGLTYGWNYMPCCFVSGGFGNTIKDNSAENHGSVALSGYDTQGLVNFNNKGKNLHDNNIYVSSGSMCVSLANVSDQVSGSNVKTRGSANASICNIGNDANTSVDVSGNGTTPDAQDANGSSNIAGFNTSLNSRSHDFRLVKQDGLPLRHSLLAFNLSDGHKGSGDFTPILVAAQKSCGVFGNVIGSSSADKVLNVTGVDNSSYGNGHLVAINIFKGDNLAANFNDNDRLIYALNQEDTQNGSEIRFADNALFLGNMNLNGRTVTASSTYPSSNTLIAYSFGSQGISAGQTNILAEGNFNNNYNYPALTEPFKAGIISWSDSNVYISVPDGAGGFEFKQLQFVSS